MKILIWIKT